MSHSKSATVAKPGSGLRLAQDASISEMNEFLVRFNREPIREQQAKGPPAPRELAGARLAYANEDWAEVQAIFVHPDTAPQTRTEIRQRMLGGATSLSALEGNKGLHVALLCGDAYTPDGDFHAAFGQSKNDAVADALRKQSYKQKAGPDVPEDGPTPRDPALFSLLAKQIDLNVWNDKGGERKRGLGPGVCAALWAQGGYDEICELIRLGVDTTVPAQTKGKPIGSHSGFIMPVQHIIQDHLRDTAQLGTDGAEGWDEKRKAQAQAAKDIFDTLEATQSAVTLTKWKDVADSEMIAEFKKEPGTIWGFEHVRQPFVTAAHDTPQGSGPLRMLELWAAVEMTLTAAKYDELITDPEATIKSVVDAATTKAASEIDSEAVYADIRADQAAFLKKFREDATAFLTEFAAQVPKGTFSRGALDTKDQPRQGKVGDREDIGVSDVAGIHWEKLMTSIACKAGLWWAKNEKKPVYYCLDGIKMKDVVNHKIVKNNAIQAFLDKGDVLDTKDAHQEVVTFQEIR